MLPPKLGVALQIRGPQPIAQCLCWPRPYLLPVLCLSYTNKIILPRVNYNSITCTMLKHCMDTKTYSCCIREVNVLVCDLEEEMVNVLKEFVSDMIRMCSRSVLAHSFFRMSESNACTNLETNITKTVTKRHY